MGATHAANIAGKSHTPTAKSHGHPASGHASPPHAGQHPAVAEQNLAKLFAAVAKTHAERIALTFAGEQTTYAELDLLSDRIASGLIERGVGPGLIVAIYLERSARMIAAMLAVVKTGATYLPLDTRYPHQRTAETVADASPVAIIGSAKSTLNGLSGATLYLRIEDLVVSPQTTLRCTSSGADAAYIIYTSGSTGRPKGVVVTHSNVARLLTATSGLFRFTPDDVWTMFHSFAFDFSVWEIWGALLTGGRLVIVPYETTRAPDEFYNLLLTEQVTILNQTPSAFALLNAQDAKARDAAKAADAAKVTDAAKATGPARQASPQLQLRTIIVGGEALNPASLKSWFSRHAEDAPRLVNMYGITETTVHVTSRVMTAADAKTEHESLIGEPLPDLELHLLDEHLCPVAAEAEGEICIGGAGVSRGYLDRPQLTAERFITDPFGPAGAKLYRSGDMARRRSDGELVYLGRRDGQVKINGFRIELGEIEAAILAQTGTRQAAVIVVEATHDLPARLAAYYVADDTIPAQTMSSFLAGRLPAHMLPAFYTQLPALPLNANGKIDRKALPAPTLSIDPAPPPPADDAIKTVASAWQRVLGVSSVPLDENFFDVGGTSLLLVAVRTALEQRFSRTIPIAWMFEHTTVRTLARRLSEPALAAKNKPAATDKPAPQAKSAALDANAQKQREAFARARAQRPAARPATPAPRRNIA